MYMTNTKKPVDYLYLDVKSVLKGKSYYFYQVGVCLSQSHEEKLYNIPVSKKIKEEYKKIGCLICDGEIDLDEYWAYKQLFTVGKYYYFSVIKRRQCNNHKTFQYVLLDRYDREQQIQSKVDVPEGAKVKCKVNGFCKTYLHKKCLDLGELSLVPDKPSDNDEIVKDDVIGSSKWYGEIKDLGRHICRQSFTCDCCGGSFGPSKGYRIEMRELYFCSKCLKSILEPSGKGYINIIYTNMGHKR